MQYMYKRIRFGAAIGFALVVLAVAPVWVKHVSALASPVEGTPIYNTNTGQTGKETQVHHSDTSATSGADSDSTAATAGSTSSDDGSASSGSDSLRDRAEQLLADKRQTGKQHTSAQRKQVCENRQTTIDSRMSTLGSVATKYLNRYNTIYTNLRAYQAKNQLDVANYDSLVNDTNAKQQAAETAVATLSGLAGTKIDCTSTDPASTLATVKTAVSDAKSSLQDYRKSLRTLIEALITAKKSTASTNSSTSGGNQ